MTSVTRKNGMARVIKLALCGVVFASFVKFGNALADGDHRIIDGNDKTLIKGRDDISVTTFSDNSSVTAYFSMAPTDTEATSTTTLTSTDTSTTLIAMKTETATSEVSSASTGAATGEVGSAAPSEVTTSAAGGVHYTLTTMSTVEYATTIQSYITASVVVSFDPASGDSSTTSTPITPTITSTPTSGWTGVLTATYGSGTMLYTSTPNGTYTSPAVSSSTETAGAMGMAGANVVGAVAAAFLANLF